MCSALAPSPRPGALDVPAFRLIPPSLRRPGRATAALVVVVLVAGCGTAATPRPSTPPDATGSLLPPITATPPLTASPSAAAAAFPVTLTDDEGTVVELKSEPKKIVSLTPATTEILFALGVGDRIVGKVEDPTPYPPEATAISDVAKFGSVDVEKIVYISCLLFFGDKISTIKSGAPLQPLSSSLFSSQITHKSG